MSVRSSSLLALACLFLNACAVPSSSLTSLSVSGQLRGPNGEPLVNKPVEVILPAEYGLNEIDLEYGEPKSYGHSDQRAIVTTDALGSFSHTFAPVEQSQKFWILPPLGTLLSSEPQPRFFVRLPDTGAAYYSVAMTPEETTYGVYVNAPGRMPMDGASAVPAPKPAELEGRLLSDQRDGATGWIANLEFTYLRPQEISRTRMIAPR